MPIKHSICFGYVWAAAGLLIMASTRAATAQDAADPPLPVAPDAVREAPPTRDASPLIEAEFASRVARPGGLTADAAAARAVASSQQVGAASARRRAASAEVDVARIRYAPRLTLSASYARLSPIDAPELGTLVAAPGAAAGQPIGPTQVLVAVPLSFPTPEEQTQLKATLTVPLLDYFVRYPQAFDAAKHGADAARYDLAAKRAQAGNEARIAYYAWCRAVLQRVAAEQSRARAVAHLRDAEGARAAGLATVADVAGVEAQVAAMDLLVVRANDNVAITQELLATQLHLPPGAALSIGEDVLAHPPPRPMPTLATAWAEAERNRPELLALAATERQLRRQAAVLRGAQLPRVDAFAEVLSANPNPRYQPAVEELKTTWMAGVQATYTINDLPSNAASRRGVSAQADAVAAQREAVRDALRAELVVATRGVSQASVKIAAAQRGLQSAEIAYRFRREQYRVGRATHVELTDAETDLTRARLDVIDAIIDARVAAVRLDHALGR